MNPESQSSGGEAPQRDPITKADGVTDAEKYLARLCEKSFLSLWSYPGVYRDQGKLGSAGHGKEICDLLVIFDKHIIIFSDKQCALQNSGDVERDWRRWFKKAIQNSAEQAWGAERWIRQQPGRVFLDRECKHSLPIDLPSVEKSVFHLVVVAHGISPRIKQYFPESSGSLLLNLDIKGFENHTAPFYLGDLAPHKTFVHVLDDDSLRLLMAERDTISDFVAYLSKRKLLLRGSPTIRATGEEQLLAIYLRNLNGADEHDFIFPTQPGTHTHIYVPDGHWEQFLTEPQRIAQVQQDHISYAWDKLIEKFSYYALRGEQYHATNGGVKDTERVLRFMAREPRWKRRYLARSLVEIVHTTPGDKRRLRVQEPAQKGDPYYVFVLVPILSGWTADEYRTVRRNFLEGCCSVVELERPDAEDIVGIATEPGANSKWRSEDAIYFDARNWTEEMAVEARTFQERFRILKSAKTFKGKMTEYPDLPTDGTRMKNPRNKPCPCGSGKKYKHCCLNNQSK